MVWHLRVDGALLERRFRKIHGAIWRHLVYRDHYVSLFVLICGRLTRANCVHNTANMSKKRYSLPYTQAMNGPTVNTVCAIGIIGILLGWHYISIYMALNRRLNQWSPRNWVVFSGVPLATENVQIFVSHECKWYTDMEDHRKYSNRFWNVSWLYTTDVFKCYTTVSSCK